MIASEPGIPRRVRAPLEDAEDSGLSRRVEVHDRNQLELKLGYTLDPRQKTETYRIDAFMFLPRTLGIGAHNYGSATFYHDTAAFLRFQTPRVPLRELADAEKAVEWFAPIVASQGAAQENLKVLGCIYRSAVRRAVGALRTMARELRNRGGSALREGAEALSSEIYIFVEELVAARSRLKNLERHCIGDVDVAQAYRIVDEYVAIVSEDVAVGLLHSLDKTLQRLAQRDGRDAIAAAETLTAPRRNLAQACVRLATHTGNPAPPATDDEDDDDDETFPYRRRLLKRAVFKPLYLEIRGSASVRVAHNLVGMFAAALAMAFAIGVAIWSQVVWGVISWPFIVIAIFSYMIKDRIKEWGRTYFRRRFKRFFPDHAHIIHAADGRELGVLRERFEVRDPSECDADVLRLRYPSRDDSLGREARPEVVFAYAKQVTLSHWSSGAQTVSSRFVGVHDIIRFNLGRLRSRMDDPDETYRRVDPETLELVKVRASRVYHINLVLKYSREDGHGATASLERLRLVVDQRGIKRVEDATNA